MTRWYYKSVFDELRDMRYYRDTLFSRVAEPGTTALLPAAGRLPVQLLPAHQAGLRVDVSERGDYVIVTADMIPGVLKEEISLDLINPRALEISSNGMDDGTGENEVYLQRERGIGSMRRIIPLPKPVSEDGAMALFQEGILIVRLKKRAEEFRKKIEIE